jgi:hypothetical protein
METQFKTTMTRYVDNAKQLQAVNKEASVLREARGVIEMDLSALYNEHELPNKVQLTQSKMQFAMKKPGEWKKGWTLSKKQLEMYLHEILPEHGADVFQEIIKRHEKTLVATDYSFELRQVESKED